MRLLLRRFLLLLPVLLAPSSDPASAEQLPTVVITGDPVAPSPSQDGTGLCTTSRVSTNPAADFPTSNSGFNFGVNTFLDTPPDAANPNARVTSVLRTWFDLSNNNDSGLRLSYGDFENATPGCRGGGCDFIINDTYTSFATRFRGYINITSDKVGLPVHFGFYADDAVAFTLYDKQSRAYPIINRPPQLGAPTWRTTNSVTFLKAGLYPVEVLYTEITEHAALEMSVRKGTFNDFERPANQPPVVKLTDAGFSLAQPELFYQSEMGQPSYSDLNKCEQCNRQYAGTAGNNGCDPGYYCNGAAVCDVCDTAFFCGASCSPCGGRTPFCVARSRDHVCVECRQNEECAAPDACHVGVCDASGTCSFPTVTEGTACPGGTCQAGVCVPPDTSNPDGGGSPDGGGAGPDGGQVGSDGGSTGSGPDAGMGADAGTAPGSGDGNQCGDGQPRGCSCGTGTPPLAPLSLLGLALLRRRVRRVRSG